MSNILRILNSEYRMYSLLSRRREKGVEGERKEKRSGRRLPPVLPS
jgi:hypothetical protein